MKNFEGLLKEKIVLRFPRVKYNGDDDSYKLRMDKLVKDILKAVKERDAFVIGEDEPEPENIEHPYYETDLRETRERNERLEWQRKRAEESL